MRVGFLKIRAEKFFNNAKKLLEEKDYEISAFCFEQSAQLLLKHYLFVKLKDFPKIHSLTKLLKYLGKAYQKEKVIEKFINENIAPIADLEEAYISSRYLPREFYKPQVEEMERFTEKLIDFLKKL